MENNISKSTKRVTAIIEITEHFSLTVNDSMKITNFVIPFTETELILIFEILLHQRREDLEIILCH